MEIGAAHIAGIAAARLDRAPAELEKARPPAGPSPQLGNDQGAVKVSLSPDIHDRREQALEQQPSTESKFAVDPRARGLVFQVVDTRSGEVVMQLPEEALLRRRAYSQSLDEAGSAPAAQNARLSRVV